MKKYPFIPIKTETALKLAKPFEKFAKPLTKFFPNLKEWLKQSDLDFTEAEYSSLAALSAFTMGALSFVAILIFASSKLIPRESFLAALLAALVFFFVDFFYQLFYPSLIISNKIKLLEKDLLFALRYTLIKIKSGVPLYDAMVGVAEGDYGEVSKEFKKTVKEIATGTEDVVALENMALRNPSVFFRRTIWQIASNMRAGADIAHVLEGITSTIVMEQKIMIRRYGSELNPLILMYMMFSVVVPSLGVTVIVVMSSFSGIQMPIYVFYLLPIYVFLTQVIFMRMIKAKKPMLSL